MEKLIANHNGAKFYKIDLHVHTPASRCYKVKNITAADIVNQAVSKDLAIIAITDHNSPGWYQQVANAAKDTELLVLPGVELTCTPGTHLLAIFDPEMSWAVEALLHRAKLPRNQWGNETAYLTWSVETTLREIKDLGGIAIAPHIDSSRGVLEKIYGKKQKVSKILTDHAGQTKAGVLKSEYLDGVSITKLETKGFLKRLLETDPHYKREFSLAFLLDSDSHQPDDIGRRFSLAKMNQPTFLGLKQALLDNGRILINELPILPSAQIIGLRVEGGFLGGQEFHFNEYLNCIIGGRGSGKSAAITFLRMALDPGFFKEKQAELQQEDHLPRNLMLWLKVGEQTIYIKVDLVKWKRTCYYYEEGKLKFAPSLQNKSWAEIYGLGEIYHLAELEVQQLALIDRLIRSSLKFQKDEVIFLEKERKLVELRTLRDNFERQVISYKTLKRIYDKANYDLIILGGKSIKERDFDYLKNTLRNFLAIVQIVKDKEVSFVTLYTKLGEANLFLKGADEKEKPWLLEILEKNQTELALLRNSFLEYLEVEKKGLVRTFSEGINIIKTLTSYNQQITIWRQKFCQDLCSQEGSQFCLNIVPHTEVLGDPVVELENMINFNFYYRQEVISLEQFAEKLQFNDDSIDFSLKVGKAFKPIEKLSKGQKSVLVLMLLAFEERNAPLIIAQPETDLDHDYIFHTMVRMLRKLKTKRQVIITTYNANIVVSADAELILVLDNANEQGRITKSGSIDDEEVAIKVQEVLEGGVEAFRLRLKKYGYI